MKHLIFDGSNVLWRAHWIAHQYNPEYEYQDVNIFMSIVHNLCTTLNCFNVYIAWDDRELRHEPNPRRVALQQYKQNRTQSATCYQHIEQIKDLTTSLGITHVRPYALEGDDVISVLCDVLPGEKIVISADQDLAQLVSPDISFYSLTKKQLITYDNFTEYFSVSLEHFVTYKCILGDSSDNIPGVPKYGVKRASKLAKQFHDAISEIPEHIVNIIEQNRNIIDLKRLITPQEVEFITNQLQEKSVDLQMFRSICERYNLNKTSQLNTLGFILT